MKSPYTDTDRKIIEKLTEFINVTGLATLLPKGQPPLPQFNHVTDEEWKGAADRVGLRYNPSVSRYLHDPGKTVELEVDNMYMQICLENVVNILDQFKTLKKRSASKPSYSIPATSKNMYYDIAVDLGSVEVAVERLQDAVANHSMALGDRSPGASERVLIFEKEVKKWREIFNIADGLDYEHIRKDKEAQNDSVIQSLLKKTDEIDGEFINARGMYDMFHAYGIKPTDDITQVTNLFRAKHLVDYSKDFDAHVEGLRADLDKNINIHNAKYLKKGGGVRSLSYRQKAQYNSSHDANLTLGEMITSLIKHKNTIIEYTQILKKQNYGVQSYSA